MTSAIHGQYRKGPRQCRFQPKGLPCKGGDEDVPVQEQQPQPQPQQEELFNNENAVENNNDDFTDVTPENIKEQIDNTDEQSQSLTDMENQAEQQTQKYTEETSGENFMGGTEA